MKIQDRSDELCRENERLHNQVGALTKELEVEKGKVKTKIKEIMEERDKNKRLDAQLIGKAFSFQTILLSFFRFDVGNSCF